MPRKRYGARTHSTPRVQSTRRIQSTQSGRRSMLLLSFGLPSIVVAGLFPSAFVPTSLMPHVPLALSMVTWISLLIFAEAAAWFSASAEAALDRCSHSGVLAIADRHGKREQTEERLKNASRYQFAARLTRFLGNACVVVSLAYLALRGSAIQDDEGVGTFSVSTAVVVLGTAFLLTFIINDVLARLVACRNPDRYVYRALPFLRWLRFATAPLCAPLLWLGSRLFQVRLLRKTASAREEILESVEEGERAGSFSATEADMIESIIDMGRSRVEDVMTPRADLVMLHVDASLQDALTTITEEGYSRIPIYKSDRDDVVGVLYARDLLPHWGQDEGSPVTVENGETTHTALTVRGMMRKPLYVPEGKRVSDLLGDMRANKVHMGIVLDEFNGTAGVVTIEDLLEEIVGEIQDEYDEDEDEVTSASADGVIQVPGRTTIEDVNRALHIELPIEEDFETVGGLVFNRLGQVPVAGDELRLDGATLTVLEADERTVQSVRVARQDTTNETDVPPSPARHVS